VAKRPHRSFSGPMPLHVRPINPFVGIEVALHEPAAAPPGGGSHTAGNQLLITIKPLDVVGDCSRGDWTRSIAQPGAAGRLLPSFSRAPAGGVVPEVADSPGVRHCTRSMRARTRAANQLTQKPSSEAIGNACSLSCRSLTCIQVAAITAAGVSRPMFGAPRAARGERVVRSD